MATTLTCLRCGGDLDPEGRFCALCGTARVVCQGCARPLLDTDLSCPHCGTPADPVFLSDLPGDAPSPWAELADRLRRATLGEFEIGHELGRGGMAAVFLAHDIALDRKVAIKVMSPGLLLGDGMTERFRHEAITVARLHHPHIVSVHSVRHAEGLHFFVMRYVRGGSLEQVIRRAGPLPIPIVRSVLSQVGSALTYAHRTGVIHRDIKPANILIAEDGDAIVTDFGIAKAAERPTQTLTGALVGTPAYMSPEQCHGGEIGWASDQYSLGAVAFEMLAGRPPFGGSTFTVMQAHIESPPQRVREVRDDCPPELEAAVLRMLEKEPAARWPRMADAIAALGAAPLGDDDPLRAELSRWAVSGGAPAVSGKPTPTSPVPRTGASLDDPGADRRVSGISIMPAPPDLEVGDSFKLVAVIRGPHGTRLPPQAVSWNTEPPGVLRLDPEAGMAGAVASGSTMLSATCKGIRAVLRVDVAAPRTDEIAIGPAHEPLHVGDEIQLEATPRDKRGWPVTRPVVWQSADPAVAQVTSHGAIAGRAPGTVRISCALDGVSASIVIPVLPPRVAVLDVAPAPATVAVGRTFTLTATPLDRMNVPLPRRPVLWSTSDAVVAMITAEGWVAAMRPGSAVLTATCEGLSASVRVTVVAEPAAAVAPRAPPTPPRRRSHRSRRIRLLGAGAMGAVGVALWAPRSPAPSVESAAARTAEPMGYVEPSRGSESAGSTEVVGRPAGAASHPDSARLARRGRGRAAAAVGSIAIVPQRPLRVGEAGALTALVLDAGGDTLAGADITWSSSDAGVATVDPATGRVQARAPGTVLILARSGSESTLSELRVLPGAATYVRILGVRPMAVGETLQLRLFVRDAWGNGIDEAPVVWASTDSGVAAVDRRSGAVTARSPGSTRITATVGGIADGIYLNVVPRPEPVRPGGADALVEAGVARCYEALRDRDVGRVTAMYRAATKHDRDLLKRLTRILGTESWSPGVGARLDGAPQVGPADASMTFRVPLAWRDSHGEPHSITPEFRAEFARSAAGWEMSSCRIIGSPGL